MAEAFLMNYPTFFQNSPALPKNLEKLQWDILLCSIFDAEFKSAYIIEFSYLGLKIFLFFEIMHLKYKVI
jgi:hypothetical protein